MTGTPSETPRRLTLEGELTQKQASDVHRLLTKELNMHFELELDLSLVTELDGAGLQLLLCLYLEARREQRWLRFVEPSFAVREVFELLRLSGYLSNQPDPNASFGFFE